MKVFLDANILLDILARREPFYRNAARIGTLVEAGKIEGIVAAFSIPTVFYLVRRKTDVRAAHEALKWIRDFFTLATCDDKVIYQAMDAGWQDFEDAVQYFSACRAEASLLVTRDEGHFRGSDLPVVSPEALLASLSDEGQ
jgi:predicted nucleic acid-binding protein